MNVLTKTLSRAGESHDTPWYIAFVDRQAVAGADPYPLPKRDWVELGRPETIVVQVSVPAKQDCTCKPGQPVCPAQTHRAVGQTIPRSTIAPYGRDSDG